MLQRTELEPEKQVVTNFLSFKNLYISYLKYQFKPKYKWMKNADLVTNNS